MVDPRNLTALANQYGSDKGDEIFHKHGYSHLYSFIFEPFREEEFAMLEIGLQRGGVDHSHLVQRKGSDLPSIRMWMDFFPKAFVFGADISDFNDISLERFQFHRLDAGDTSALKSFIGELPPLKLIIDDASHAPYHQQLMLVHLFPKLVPGGFYVIEDIHASHPIEQQLPKCSRTGPVIDEFLKTGQLNIDFMPMVANDAIASKIARTFVHRNDKGGTNKYEMKMAIFEKK